MTSAHVAFAGWTLWPLRYTRSVYRPAASEALSAWQLIDLLKLSVPLTWPETVKGEGRLVLGLLGCAFRGARRCENECKRQGGTTGQERARGHVQMMHQREPSAPPVTRLEIGDTTGSLGSPLPSAGSHHPETAHPRPWVSIGRRLGKGRCVARLIRRTEFGTVDHNMFIKRHGGLLAVGVALQRRYFCRVQDPDLELWRATRQLHHLRGDLRDSAAGDLPAISGDPHRLNRPGNSGIQEIPRKRSARVRS